jgi:hypothetical protein
MSRKPVTNLWSNLIFFAIVFEVVVWAATGSGNPLKFTQASVGIIVVCSILLLFMVNILLTVLYMQVFVPNKQCDCGCGHWLRTSLVYVYGWPTPCMRKMICSCDGWYFKSHYLKVIRQVNRKDQHGRSYCQACPDLMKATTTNDLWSRPIDDVLSGLGRRG